jgi:hypothetical protein
MKPTIEQVLDLVKSSTADLAPGNSQKVLEYTLRVKGLFGRNRKVKFQSFKLAIDQMTPLFSDYVQALVDAKLAEIKVKSGQCTVYVQEMTLEAAQYEAGGPVYISRSFGLFTGSKMQEFAVENSKVVQPAAEVVA